MIYQEYIVTVFLTLLYRFFVKENFIGFSAHTFEETFVFLIYLRWDYKSMLLPVLVEFAFEVIALAFVITT